MCILKKTHLEPGNFANAEPKKTEIIDRTAPEPRNLKTFDRTGPGPRNFEKSRTAPDQKYSKISHQAVRGTLSFILNKVCDEPKSFQEFL